MIYLQNNGTPRAYPKKSIIYNEILIYSKATSFRREKKKQRHLAHVLDFPAPVVEITPNLQFNGKHILIVKYFLRI